MNDQPDVLFVLFDGRCGLCRRARSFLEAQTQWTPLVFVDLHSAQARRRWPTLQKAALAEQMHVVANDGRVWRGAAAWVMCLWATAEHRGKAIWLVEAEQLPAAEKWVKALSARRLALSRTLR